MHTTFALVLVGFLTLGASQLARAQSPVLAVHRGADDADPAGGIAVDNQGGATLCRVRGPDGVQHALSAPVPAHSMGMLFVSRALRGVPATLETCDGFVLWSGRLPLDGTLSVDYAAPGPTSPVMLAIAARAAAGIVAGGATTGFGVWQGEARVGISVGDCGIGLVLRAGVAELGAALGEYSTAGTWFSGEALVAVLGASASHGFFARGAYFGLGVADVFNAPAATASLHQPLLWFSDVSYVGLDVTGYVEPVGSFTDRGGQGPFGAVSLGLETVLSD